MSRAIGLLSVCLIALECSQQTTDELLAAKFFTSGLTKIELLSPAENGFVTKSPTLVWGTKSGISQYLLEVAAKADFSSVVLTKTISGGSYTLKNSDLSGISALDTVQYYWRVSATKVSPNLQSNTGTFQVLSTDIIYVDCNAASNVQSGNKSTPLKKIQQGIDLANSYRNYDRNVTRTVLVAQGTYNETLTLRAGIAVIGGYEATNWTRTTNPAITILRAASDTAIISSSEVTATYTSTTEISNFRIDDDGGGGATARTGIFIYNSCPTIRNNFINGSTTTATAINVAISIQGSLAAPLIYNNVITGHTNTGGGSATGIKVSDSANPVITNNTIIGRTLSAGASYGIRIDSASPTLTNNIIFSQSTVGTRRCIHEENLNGTNSDPNSFHNNLLFDCASSLYYEENTTALSTDAALSDPLQTTQNGASSASGNLGTTTIANFAAVNFASSTDWHLTGATPVAVRNGGRNAGTSVCGYLGSATCGAVMTDIEGKPRTLPYSIGAYEQD